MKRGFRVSSAHVFKASVSSFSCKSSRNISTSPLKHPDVTIIGAGIIGLSTAMVASEMGHHVTIYDSEPDCARRSSYSNGGLWCPGHAVPMVDRPSLFALVKLALRGRLSESAIRFKMGKILRDDPVNFLKWGVQLVKSTDPVINDAITRDLIRRAQESLLYIEKLIVKYDLQIDRNCDGILNIYWSQKDLVYAWNASQVFLEMGVDVHTLNREPCLKLEPSLKDIDFVGGIYCPGDISFDTRKMCQELCRILISQGHTIHHGRSITYWTNDQIVLDNKDPVKFEKLVICTGAETKLFATHLDTKMYNIKGHSVTWRLSNTNSIPKIPIFDTNSKVVITPFENRVRIVGIAEFSGNDTSVDPNRISHLKSCFQRMLPNAFTTTPPLEESHFACLRATASNSTPIIKQIAPNVYINVGHGHLGSTVSFSSALGTCALF